MAHDVISALPIKRRHFVQEYVENGGNATAAATAAGYEPSAASTVARELIRLPEVQRAIEIEQKRAYSRLVSIGIKRLEEILKDPLTKPSVVVDAVVKLGDRAGLAPRSDLDRKPDTKPIEEMTLDDLTQYIQRREESLTVVSTEPEPPPGHVFDPIVPTPTTEKAM